MTQRAVTVLLTAITGPYVANMGRAATATAGVGTAAQGAQAKTGLLGGAMSGLAGKLAAGGGLLWAMNEGVDLLTSYQDALVGVGKTTGLTGAELSGLGAELSRLAVGIEGSAEDMLGIAQSAAQLGVSNGNIVEFTRVIADMASATDLTTQQAATDMARLSNILGRPIEDVEALGSVIVQLGNTMATTEPEILNLSMRLGAAGRTAGFTDAEVVGLAASMSSLGIEAEAGGTAMSRVMNEVTRAVGTGSEKLGSFAAAAGMSAEAFTEAWSDDPAAVLAVFLDGLGRLSEAERFGVMEDLGLDAQRLTDVLLRTSAGAQGVADSFDAANQAEAENVAIAEEAATANERLSVALEGLGDELKRQGREFLGNEEGARALADGVRWLTDNVDGLLGPLRNVYSPLNAYRDETEAAAAATGALTADQAMLQSAARGTTDVVADTAVSVADLGREFGLTAEQQRNLADAMLAATDPAYGYVQAQSAAQEASAAYAEAVAEHGSASDEAAAALLDLLDAEQRVDAAALQAGQSFDDLTGNVDRLEEAGRLTADQADRLRAQIAGAREEAERFAGDYMSNLTFTALLDIEAVNVSDGQRVSLGQVGYRAQGGPVDAGAPYVVGERGPELFVPDTAGRIIPAGETARMAGGAGTTHRSETNVNAYGIGADEVAALVARKVSDQMWVEQTTVGV